MDASLVEISWHVFLIFRLIFSHFCSHVIGTLQKRVVNNA